MLELHRQKLDSIVSQMQNEGQPDDEIQFVVNDFKSKYDVPKPPELPKPVSEPKPEIPWTQQTGTYQPKPEDIKVDLAAQWKPSTEKAVSPVVTNETIPEVIAPEAVGLPQKPSEYQVLRGKNVVLPSVTINAKPKLPSEEIPIAEEPLPFAKPTKIQVNRAKNVAIPSVTEITGGELPPETLAQKTGKSFLSSIANLESTVAASPGLLVDSYLVANNLVNKAVNTATKKAFGTKILEEDYKAPKALYNLGEKLPTETLKSAFGAERLKKTSEEFSQQKEMQEPGEGVVSSIFEKIKRGEIKNAAEYLGYATIETGTQNMLAALITIATKNPKLGIAALSGTVASQTMRDAVNKDPTADRTMAVLNSITQGLAEYGGEVMGTMKILQPLRRVFLETAKKEGIEAAQKQSKNYFVNLFKGLGTEAGSEVVTQFAQDLSGLVSGQEKYEGPKTLAAMASNMLDAGLLAVTSAGPMVGISAAAETREAKTKGVPYAEGNGTGVKEAGPKEGPIGGTGGPIRLRDNAEAGKVTSAEISGAEVVKEAANLSDEEAAKILAKAKAPKVDVSKLSADEVAGTLDRAKFDSKQAEKARPQEPSPYQLQQPTDENRATGETVAKKYGLRFKEAVPGDRDKGGVKLVFTDPVTDNELSLFSATADSEAAKITDRIRQEKPEEYGKKIADGAGVEFLGRKAQITEATSAGKYNTEAVGNYRTKLGNEFTVPFSAGIEEVKRFAEETDKRGAPNVPEVQKRKEEVEQPVNVKSLPINQDTDRMLRMYVKTGKTETSPSRAAHQSVIGVLDQVAPEDIADAVGITPAEAREAIGDIRALKKSDLSQKVRQSLAPSLFYGQPVQEVVDGIRQPRSAGGEVMFSREEQFVRASTKKEKHSNSAKREGFNSIPDKTGFEKVYKPYGEQGAGYYYLKKIEPAQRDIFGGETPVSQIEREAAQRQERQAVEEKTTARKGGEAPLSGLPMFENQNIEGSQQTLQFSREERTMDLDTAKEMALSNGFEYVTSIPGDGGPAYTFKDKHTGTEFNVKTRGDVRTAAMSLSDRIAPKGTVKAGEGVRFSRERTPEQEAQITRLKARKEAEYIREVQPEEAALWKANNNLIDFFRENGYTIQDTPQGVRYVQSTAEDAERYWSEFDRNTATGFEEDAGFEAFGKSRQAPRTEPAEVKFSREWSQGDEPLTPKEQRENFEWASRDIEKEAQEVPATDREDRNAEVGVQTSLQLEEPELIYDSGTDADRAHGQFIADQLKNVKFNGVWKGFRSKDGKVHRDPALTFTIYDNQGKGGTSILAPLNATAGHVAKRRMDALKGEVRFQIEEPRKTADTFFSPVLRAVQGLKQERGTGEQMFAMITKTPGVKEAEWKWMGLDDFLKGKQSVTKAEIEEFVRQNQVRVEEVKKGDTKESGYEFISEGWSQYWDGAVYSKKQWEELLKDNDQFKSDYDDYLSEIEGDDVPMSFDKYLEQTLDEELRYTDKPTINTKFSQYSLPGGENYREVLLTLPVKQKISYENWRKAYDERFPNSVAEEKTIREMYDKGQTIPGQGKFTSEPIGFKSSHWDESNVIAHVRLNDRTGPNGEKVLFVEEIQSDYAREAREKGIQGKLPEGWTVKPNIEKEGETKFKVRDEKGVLQGFGETEKEAITMATSRRGGVPAQPFLKNWEELTLKRVLRMAAEEGYDRVAWINGQQTKERYREAILKVIDRLHYSKMEDGRYDVTAYKGNDVVDVERTGRAGIYTEEELSKTFGKDISESIVKGEGNQSDNFPKIKELDVKGLTLGGEWANALYDRMIPKFYEKYGKRWNTKVEEVSIGKGDSENEALLLELSDGTYAIDYNGDRIEYDTEQAARSALKEIRSGQMVQQSIAITPEMKESVLYEGQPMFQREPTNLRREAPTAVPETSGRNLPAEDREAGNTVPENVSAVMALTRGIERDLGQELPEGSITAVDAPQEEVYQVADRLISEEFGRTPVWFRVSREAEDAGVRIGGAKLNSLPGVVFINIKTKKPVIVTPVHETMHIMQEENPDLYYPVLETMLEQATPEFAAYRQKMLDKGYTDREVMDEMVAEISGERFTDPEFLQALHDRSPEAFRAFVETLRRVIQQIKDWINKSGIEHAGKYFVDLNRVDRVLQDSLIEMRRRSQPEMKMAAQREAKFSREENYDSAYVYYMEKFDDILSQTVENGLKSKKEHQQWTPLKIDRLKKIWNEYSRLGIVRDEKGIDDIAEDFINKVVTLDVNTVLAGHDEINPIKLIKEKIEEVVSESDIEKISDYTNTEDGGWRISDYGLPKLRKIAIEILNTNDYNKKLLLIDSMLNIVHQRSDLASWFVDGGRGALDDISSGVRFSREDQTQTEAFRNWFKGSKVVDENGEPLVVYHGTTGNFTEFNTHRAAPDKMGAYFTESKKGANLFARYKGGNVLPVYLSIQKPLDLRGKDINEIIDSLPISDAIKYKQKQFSHGPVYAYLEGMDRGYKIVPKLRQRGYDGIVFEHGGEEGITWVAFSPTQIKSATGNRGTFDPENPDIRFSRETPEGTVPLYRGDSKEIGEFDITEADPRALFGQAIYLTDSKRIAGDYKNKGAGFEEGVLYKRQSKTGTKKEAYDAWIRQRALYVDENGNDIDSFNGEQLPVFEDDPIRNKRIAQAEKKANEEFPNLEIRKQADGLIVIRSGKAPKTGTQINVPKDVLSKTLDAEAEIPVDVVDALYSALRDSRDQQTAKDMREFAMRKDEFGQRPSYRDIYTSITSDSQLISSEGQAILREKLQALGYTGIKYAGGITMGGARHNAYALWNTDFEDKVRFSREEPYKVVDKRAAHVTEDQLPAIYEEAKTFDGKTAAERLKKRFGIKKQSLALSRYILRTVSGTLLEISPVIRDALQKQVNRVLIDTAKANRRILPLVKAISKMPEEDAKVFDIAAKNADSEKINELAGKYGFRDALDEYRKVMDEIVTRAREAGYETGYLKDYFPRMPKDRDAYRNYIRGLPEWGQIEEAMREKSKAVGHDLNEDEQAEFLNLYIRGYGNKMQGGPGQLKERTVKYLDNEMNALLEDTRIAIPLYVEGMIKKIARKEFFGNKKETDELYINDIDQSIGDYVAEQIRQKHLDPVKQDQLVGLLKSYFNYKPTNRTVAALKNVGYAASMGSGFSSMFSQMQDAAFGFYTAPGSEAGSVIRSLLGKTEITIKDLGIDDIAAEFRDPGKLAKFVDKLLRGVGLKWGDSIFKNAFIDANLKKYRAMAKSGKINKDFRRDLDNTFGDEAESVIADLKSGVDSDNVKLLMLNQISKFQPVTLLQVPQAYLDAPRARVAYALKTYQVNQFNAIIDESLRAMDGAKDVKAFGRAFGRIAGVTACLIAAGVGTDRLKDFLFRRQCTWGQYTVDNILKLMFISRYVTWQAREQGLYSAIVKLVAPPMSWMDYIGKDINKAFTKPEDFKLKDMESVRILPVIGQEFYWWTGGGYEKQLKQAIRKSEPKRFQRELNKREAKAEKVYAKGDTLRARELQQKAVEYREENKAKVEEYYKKEAGKEMPRNYNFIIQNTRTDTTVDPKKRYRAMQMYKKMTPGQQEKIRKYKRELNKEPK